MNGTRVSASFLSSTIRGLDAYAIARMVVLSASSFVLLLFTLIKGVFLWVIETKTATGVEVMPRAPDTPCPGLRPPIRRSAPRHWWIAPLNQHLVLSMARWNRQRMGRMSQHQLRWLAPARPPHRGDPLRRAARLWERQPRAIWRIARLPLVSV